MMKIAFAVAIAAAVLTPAPLLVGTIPAEAQTQEWRKASMFRSGGTATVPDGTTQMSLLASDQAASLSARGKTAAW